MGLVVQQALPDQVVPQVPVVRQAILVLVDRQDKLEIPVKQARQGLQDPVVLVAPVDLADRQVQQAILVKLDLQDQQDIQVQLDIQDRQDRVDLQEQVDLPE